MTWYLLVIFFHKTKYQRLDVQRLVYDLQLKNNETNASLYSNLAGMYTKGDQFVIPLTRTFCGNLLPQKLTLVQQNSPKLPV